MFSTLENSTLHFKMYKAGKSWMVAGLMTTAVLAGLTLGNVNTTEAHAAVASPAVAQQSSAAKTDSSAAASAAVTPLQSATKAQSDAQVAFNTAIDNVNKAGKAYNDASAALSTTTENAKTAHSNWDADVAALKGDHETLNQAGQALSQASDSLDHAATSLANDKNYQYVIAKDKANAAATKAHSDAAAAYQAYVNEPNEWNDEAQQVASAAADKADAQLSAANQALNTIKSNAQQALLLQTISFEGILVHIVITILTKTLLLFITQRRLVITHTAFLMAWTITTHTWKHRMHTLLL